MLQGVQRQVDQIRRLGVAVDSDNAALLTEAIEHFVSHIV
jgi:hypothetical protein